MKIAIACDHGALALKNTLIAHLTNNTGADGHHVGVVMLTGHTGGHHIAQQRAADALDLVGGDGNTDAGGAKDDALVTFAACYGLGGRSGKVGIVAAIQSISAEVDDFVTLLFQVGNHQILQFQCAVIATNRNFHK